MAAHPSAANAGSPGDLRQPVEDDVTPYTGVWLCENAPTLVVRDDGIALWYGWDSSTMRKVYGESIRIDNTTNGGWSSGYTFDGSPASYNGLQVLIRPSSVSDIIIDVGSQPPVTCHSIPWPSN